MGLDRRHRRRVRRAGRARLSRRVTASPVAVGSGRIGSAHGDLPVPPPAVLELARGWQVLAGGEGELATPTGMALIRALADECGPIGPMEITASGWGGRARRPWAGQRGPRRPRHSRRRTPTTDSHVGAGDEHRRPGSAGLADGAGRAAGGGSRRRVARADRDEEGSAGAHAMRARREAEREHCATRLRADLDDRRTGGAGVACRPTPGLAGGCVARRRRPDQGGAAGRSHRAATPSSTTPQPWPGPATSR